MNEFTASAVPFQEELAGAKLTYKRIAQTVAKAFKSVRLGQVFSYAEIDESAAAITESLLRNADALVSLAQVKGNETYLIDHSVNVAILAAALAGAMGYEGDTMLEVALGGLLHDIGMCWVPEKIFAKQGTLSDAEFSIVKRHPEYGVEIVKNQKAISDRVKKIIGQHHERMNGSGYPVGISGNRVDYFALIAGTVDVYHALTSERPYGRAFTPQQALSAVYHGMDKEFPKAVTEHFVKVIGIYPVGSFVVLASGEKGIVTRINRDGILVPDIVVLFAADGKRLTAPVEVCLAQRIKEPDGKRYKIEKVLNPREDGVTVAEYLNATAA
jgi:putative nucleotidyltransferase with HDIG domain